jgi:Uma2 family endonuclease
MSPAEFLELERRAETKHELWDGEVFAMAGASVAHNVLVANLARVLGNLLLDRPCLVLPSDMKVHVPSSAGYVYPDLLDPAARAAC